MTHPELAPPIMSDTKKLCPISREEVPVSLWQREFREARDIGIYDCPRCGRFALSFPSVQAIGELPNPERRQATACLRERQIWGEDLTVITYRHNPSADLKHQVVVWEDLIAAFPKTLPERLDRTLLNLFRLTTYPGAPVSMDGYFEPVTFAENDEAMSFTIEQLMEDELIRRDGTHTNRLIVTVKGWNRVAELQCERGRNGSKQVFVATSYSPLDLQDACDGIKRGIEAAGYEALVIRDIEHNEKICDRVIAEIRRSRFLVADFTAHRQNVYFEAGFAQGLGIPVIWTCRENQVEEAHFDTRQYNHIAWSTPDDLARRLEARIKATIFTSEKLSQENVRRDWGEDIANVVGKR